MTGYPKDSQLYLVMGIPLEEVEEKEKYLIKLFSKKFTQRKDIGIEYFKGDVTEMMQFICSYVLKKN